MATDLTRSEFPTEFVTIMVWNYKDDPYREMASMHGLFTDRAEADRIVMEIGRDGWPDFMSAEVMPLQFATLAQVAQAHRIEHIEPETDASRAEFRRMLQESAQVEQAPAEGTYLNPTRESIRAEVEAEQAVREELRVEREEMP